MLLQKVNKVASTCILYCVQHKISHFLKWPPFWLCEESGMSPYPNFFVRYCPSSVPPFKLVSLKAHFFHISAGLVKTGMFALLSLALGIKELGNRLGASGSV